MCCCGKPVVNGEMGFRWQPNDTPRIREVNPPELLEGDVLLFDEPGRCGGLDCHSHHYRVVLAKHGGTFLMVRHGGGDERFRVSNGKAVNQALLVLNSDQRYWMLSAMFYTQSDSARTAREEETMRWRSAAAQKRIKTRRLPSRGIIEVWVESEANQ